MQPKVTFAPMVVEVLWRHSLLLERSEERNRMLPSGSRYPIVGNEARIVGEFAFVFLTSSAPCGRGPTHANMNGSLTSHD